MNKKRKKVLSNIRKFSNVGYSDIVSISSAAIKINGFVSRAMKSFICGINER